MPNEVNDSPVYGTLIQTESVETLNVYSGEAQYPPLTSWQNRPGLTDELRDLLQAQHDAAVTLPYHLLPSKQPELVQVYVQQSVLPQQPDTDEPAPKPGKPEPARRIMPIAEALTTGRHLLITGGPGSGKSTLGQMYVQFLASEWLDPSERPPLPEPLMPLRVSAKALAEDRTWSELLADAVRNRKLTAPIRPELFARRALGARWLVFVDGLDEIVEPDRLRTVIDAIATRMRRGTDHQLVITSRELPSGALDQLHGPYVDRYVIEPFGPAELREFAVAWFRSQDLARATARAEEFLRQVHDGRLRELVNVPLLATIAAITNTLEPGRPLPHNRVDLFTRFMSYLLDDKASGRDTVAELRRTIDDPARLEVVEWIHAHRRDLVEHLAVKRLESERPLIEIAADWLDRPCPEEDLLPVLTSIGVFTQRDHGIDFLHRLFAEFLAARYHAPRIPADFPALDDWVRQGTESAKETSVLFTFVLWSREEGHDLGLVLRRLMEGKREHVLLAAKLLSEDVQIPDELATTILDRVVDLVLVTGTDSDPWRDIREIGRALAGLSGHGITEALKGRLRALREQPELAPSIRICSAIALGHLGSAEESARWLESFGDLSHPLALVEVARGLAEILPDGADRADRLVLRLAAEFGDADYVMVMAAAQVLLELKRHEAAADLVRRLVRRMKIDDTIPAGFRHVPEIHGEHDEEPPGWHVLVRQAAQAGCAEEAVWAAKMLFAQPFPDEYQFRETVEMMAQVGDASAVKKIVDEVNARPVTYAAVAARALHSTHPELAASLARQVVPTDPAVDDDHVVTAWRVLLTTEPEWASSLLESREIDADTAVRMMSQADLPRAHLVRQEMARTSVVKMPRYLMQAALDEGADFANELHAKAMAGSPKDRAALAPQLHEAGFEDLATELIDQLAIDHADPEVLAECLHDLPTGPFPEQAQRLLDRLLPIADHADTAVARYLAPVLRRSGRAAEAVDLAQRTFLRELGDIYVEECAETLLDVAGASSADFIVEHVVGRGLSTGRRRAVADRLIDHGLLRHAVIVWLDVLRNHGDPVEEGVKIAHRLVRCGYRQQALDTVRAALAEDRLTVTTRAQMRALLAWIEHIVPE
ncbi:hypothetical protein UK23_43055 [Lentzea aerocolonigenes]|uniref:NACHT domain-containing protein n=1 Tax=Lentzea aerocolonigenes TaxID=68170 RepID=A0A0F0GCM7_LENAE|nr:hypothetical protein [Lentzea aerocolonigenes]KJK35225.1 hypothetical protein UK23_43055 [Lentzea aerocolonigenes]